MKPCQGSCELCIQAGVWLRRNEDKKPWLDKRENQHFMHSWISFAGSYTCIQIKLIRLQNVIPTQ